MISTIVLKSTKLKGDGLKLKMDQELKQYALPAYPNVTYSQEELNQLASLYVSINSYVKQQASKWVVDGGIETEWESYLANLKNNGDWMNSSRFNKTHMTVIKKKLNNHNLTNTPTETFKIQ